MRFDRAARVIADLLILGEEAPGTAMDVLDSSLGAVIPLTIAVPTDLAISTKRQQRVDSRHPLDRN